ncbi:666d0e5b-21d7-46e8-9617-d25fbb13f4a8 [Sclerotinia trifoliorum]|uniref:666d0e5b-21d7-46e8-9617-d25fbb13f4a8 n=1 Tax=Sclerotinia trifoliorum TaxID=28548 RepID=A0A8H2VP19_9HELO|nr:666d0e5b-21d7-46e8-9617-d25fbb13f4a8 [Sclerotinia trifoliorum]
MASILKRKRAQTEVADIPKRSKPTSESANPSTKFAQSNGGFDIFEALGNGKELAQVNGAHVKDEFESTEVIDFEDLFEDLPFESVDSQAKRGLKPRKEIWEKKIPQAPKPLKDQSWRISEPVGGRMINANPVFTEDEKYLILANRMSLLIYSTSDSLLTRTIKFDHSKHPFAHIVAYELSPTDSNIVWAALSDGAIYRLDWTSGAGNDQSWKISSTGCIHMTVASMVSAGRRRDVVFTTETKKDGGWRITANELTQPDSPIQTVARTIYTSKTPINYLKTANEGSVLLAASGKSILLGYVRNLDFDTTDKIKYVFRVFDSTAPIMSLDARVYPRTGTDDRNISKKTPVVDVVVGDAKGFIFIHRDLLGNLIQSENKNYASMVNLVPARFHWHRKSVETVKWSLDGNYIISGGSETVLVLWQLDTGKKQFLPHMTSTILNVVVSPSGSSYGVQLADNSAMVLSTAELEPTANFAGIQSSVVRYAEPQADEVQRAKSHIYKFHVVQRTPAVISSSNPSHLLLGVGENPEVPFYGAPIRNCSFLQTYDLSAGHNVSKQALARTNVTTLNETPNARPMSEPRITHIQKSHDGLWLATVDEWTPSHADLDFIQHQATNPFAELKLRREICLKFWQWKEEGQLWELVSRINTPHTASDAAPGAGQILGLATDPSSLRFSTIGEDSVVRTWVPKTRKRDGIAVKDGKGNALKNWHCQHEIQLEKSELTDDYLRSTPYNGAVAFADDGSILAAAFGKNGTVHMIDPEQGSITASQHGLFEGSIVAMEILGRDLITLSDSIRVHDLVSDQLRYSLKLYKSITGMHIIQKIEMMHLAINRSSRTFAVAIPMRLTPPSAEELREQTFPPTYSGFAVFGQDSQTPLLTECFETAVSAIIPIEDSEGFLVLDGTAEIRNVMKKGTQPITALAQPTSDLQLDTITDEATGDLLQMIEDVEDEPEEAEALSPAVMEDDDDTPVVTQQELSGVFDIGPAFALPPLEEMFYQVAGLFSSKPLEKMV